MKRLFNIDSVLLIIGVIALITVLAFLSLPRVGAQDATPTLPPTTVSPAPVSDLTNTVLTDVETFLGTYGAVVGAVVVFIVQLLKSVPFFANINPRFLNLGVSAVLVIGYLLATNFGYGERYKAALDAVPQIGQILIGLLAAFGFSTAFYEGVKAHLPKA